MVKTITKVVPPQYVWSVVRERDGITVEVHVDSYAAAWCAWEREQITGYRHVVTKTRLIPDFIRGEMVPRGEATCGARPDADDGRLPGGVRDDGGPDRGALDGGPEAS